MKKRIAILVVFLLILCLTLVGCGQGGTDDKTYNIGSADSAEQSEQGGQSEQDSSDDAENLPGYNFDTGDATIMDGTNNGTTDDANDSSSDTSVSGIKNTNGTYTHNVDGYELILRTNLADYIKYDHVFYFKQLAADLGWHTKKEGQDENPDWAGYYWGDDDSCLVIFDSPSGFYHYSISYNYINGDAMVVFKRYDKDNSDITSFQVNPNGTMKANYEQLVVITYLLENIPINPNEDPFEEIQGSVQGYWTVYK